MPCLAMPLAACRPKYWNDYQTRFLSTELTTMANATRPRLAQQQAAASMSAAAARRQQLPSVGDMLAAAGTAEAAAAAAAALQRPAHGPPDAAALRRGAPADVEQPAAETSAEPERERVWAELWNPPPEPKSEWDLRAMVEKQERKQREHRAWLAARAAVGRRQGQWSDWRTDVRIEGTSDPTQPHYREWTHREIWDLITQGGRAADPRHVLHRVASPTERADFVEQVRGRAAPGGGVGRGRGSRRGPGGHLACLSSVCVQGLQGGAPPAAGPCPHCPPALPCSCPHPSAAPRTALHRPCNTHLTQGASYHPEMEDWIASLGRLIPEDDEGGIVDDAAEAALLDDEFEGFDDRVGRVVCGWV